MKIVIALDSFKESMTSLEACDEVKKALSNTLMFEKEIITVPMSDGGEGTMDTLVQATGGEKINIKVLNPIFEEIDSSYGILGDGETAVIEMASASGLELIERTKRDPKLTTSFGTGQLILDAANRGIKKVILGLGGSATNDGGVGMLDALGAKFLDADGKKIKPCGGELNKIEKINLDNINKKIKEIEFIIACDVENPFTGELGASKVFGPQKGATEEDVIFLDTNLSHFANKIREEMKIDIENLAGAGAAGGLGGAAVAFLKGSLKKGIEIIIEVTNLEEILKDADLVITGEGRIDAQTAYGKTPMGVAMVAKKYDIPVIALAGGLGDGYEETYKVGIDSVFSICQGVTDLETALKDGKKNIYKTAENIGRLINKIKY